MNYLQVILYHFDWYRRTVLRPIISQTQVYEKNIGRVISHGLPLMGFGQIKKCCMVTLVKEFLGAKPNINKQ
jgi:hypothetical protein